MFKVDTDCKAGVKFDLAGHKRRNGSEGHNPSWRCSFGIRIGSRILNTGTIRPMPIAQELTKGHKVCKTKSETVTT